MSNMHSLEGIDDTSFAKQCFDMRDTLFRISYTILHNEADCEDAVQEAVIRAYQKKEQLRDPNLFRAWMIQILKNVCFLHIRKNKRYISFADEAIEDELKQVTPEIKDLDLESALNSIKINFRLPLLLFYMEGYSIKEIAFIMGSSTGTVKSRLSRGRDMLKSILEKDGYEL